MTTVGTLIEVAEELSWILSGQKRLREHETQRVGAVGREMEDHPRAWHYVPTRLNDYVNILIATGGLTTKGRFLDIGCGIGDKPFIAERLGQFSSADGLEFNSGLTSISYYLYDMLCQWKSKSQHGPRPHSEILHGDAMTFERYGEYSYLYTYHISKDLEVRREIHQQVLRQMAPKAKYILYAYPNIMIRRKRALFDITSLNSVAYIFHLPKDMLISKCKLPKPFLTGQTAAQVLEYIVEV